MAEALIDSSSNKQLNIGQLLDEMKMLNSAEQCFFLNEALKSLSLSFVKLMSTICNDLTHKGLNSVDNQQFSSLMEDQANDLTFFRVLNEKSTDKKLKFLISYIPLLKLTNNNRVLNERLRDSYNELIQSVLEECFEEKKHLQECQDLLLLATLHPIFDSLQKLSYEKWVEMIQQTSSSQSLSSQNSSSSAETTKAPVLKSRYFPLERSASSPIKNNSGIKTDSNLNKSKLMNSMDQLPSENICNTKNDNPGMANVAQWLRYYKLHKYTDLFLPLTYAELIALSDENLIAAKITLGARKKLLNSIERVRGNLECLKALNSVDCSVDKKLIKLSEIAVYPIEPNLNNPTSVDDVDKVVDDSKSSERVTDLFIEVLKKIQIALLEKKSKLECTNEEKGETNELIKTHLKIIDKLFISKAFSDVQNLKMAKMRARLNDLIHLESTELPKPFIRKTLLHKSSSSQAAQAVYSFKTSGEKLNSMNGSIENSINARQRIQNKLGKSQLVKTNSAPFASKRPLVNQGLNNNDKSLVKENYKFHDPFDG